VSRSIPRPPPAALALVAQARHLRAALVQLSRRRPVRDPVASACEDLDLTPVQLHTVMWLGTDDALTMGELARRVAVTEKTITGVVDRLERDGLVQRERDPVDRRVVQVRLAARGAQLFRRIDGDIEAQLTRFLGLLEARDRQHLVRMLEKLTAKLAAEET
jgi:DNA-binding MarR family transcriptional regulator